MKFNNRQRDQMRALCGEICEEDGVSAAEFYQRRASDHQGRRKTWQLCRQVAETLHLVLTGDCRDPLLQGLQVEAVEPAPNASRLLVTVRADARLSEAQRQQVEARLAEQAGWLRCEIAAAITRRKTPKLAFQVAAQRGSSSSA